MPAYKTWDDERARALIAENGDGQGTLLPILHVLVGEFGYVDPAADALIADALNISRAEVYGVVAFYHDFRRKPAGRHSLKLCRAEACQAAGGEAIATRTEQLLRLAMGETAGDDSVTLEPVYCLGLCATAPAAMLDGELHGRIDDTRLDALLAEIRK